LDWALILFQDCVKKRPYKLYVRTMMTRIDDTFARLKSDGKKAFVTFTMAGDPDYADNVHLIKA